MCQFHVYSKVTHLYIYKYLFFFKWVFLKSNIGDCHAQGKDENHRLGHWRLIDRINHIHGYHEWNNLAFVEKKKKD